MHELTEEEVDRIRAIRPWPNDNARWHEGVRLLGYWASGDSYLFASRGATIAISRDFIQEALSDAATR